MNPIISFAFTDDANDHWDNNKDAISIDVLNSNFNGIKEIKDFQNLERFRCSWCANIRQLTFSNCPNLMAIEAQYCQKLEKIIIKNCPNLRAIDFAVSPRIKEIEGLSDCHNIQYMCLVHNAISDPLPVLPSLLYLDIKSIKIQYNFDFTKHPLLEEFRGDVPEINIKDIAEHEHIVSLNLFDTKFNGEINENMTFKSLQFLSLNQIPSEQFPKNLFIFDITGAKIGTFPKDVKPCTWRKSALLLYGPWGIPPIDKQLYTGNEKIDIHQICSLPDKADKQKAANAIAGAIFGSAIMDMVGVGVEFNSEAEAMVKCREKFDMTWSHPINTPHCVRFIKGTATDDTSQSVLIMRTLVRASDPIFQRKVDNKSCYKVGPVFVDAKNFGERILDWASHGHREHRQLGGMGIGNTVLNVITSKNYVNDPVLASKQIWEVYNKMIAANGSVMRNAPCGCICFWDEKVVKEVSELFGKFTHYDPRCVFSCVCSSLLEAKLIQKAAGLIEDFNIMDTVEEAVSLVPDIKSYPNDLIKYSSAENVNDLELADQPKIGYTFKAFGSALYALKHAESFTDAMEQIISHGGDADTNGAVVGALMGAKCGFDQLPIETLQLMHCNEWLYQETSAFLKLMGLEAPPRRW